MIGELLQLLVSVIEFIWPFKIIHQWERARFYCFGRMYFGELGPGLYPFLPWFMEIIPVEDAYIPIMTHRQDITLKDDRVLSFAAAAQLRVIDSDLALNSVEHYHDTAKLLIASFLAQEMVEADAERFAPPRRKRLFNSLEAGLATEAAKFGVELKDLSFTSFVLAPRAYRLLSDGNAGS